MSQLVLVAEAWTSYRLDTRPRTEDSWQPRLNFTNTWFLQSPHEFDHIAAVFKPKLTGWYKLTFSSQFNVAPGSPRRYFTTANVGFYVNSDQSRLRPIQRVTTTWRPENFPNDGIDLQVTSVQCGTLYQYLWDGCQVTPAIGCESHNGDQVSPSPPNGCWVDSFGAHFAVEFFG